MIKDIKTLIQNYQCPLINAFFFDNGEMLLLESIMGEAPSVRVICQSTVESFYKYNDENYICNFDILEEYKNEHYIVGVGEGSYGADGVIYLRNKHTEKLVWLLFLDNSNPFRNVTIENDIMLVESTRDILFKIPISKPEDISLR